MQLRGSVGEKHGTLWRSDSECWNEQVRLGDVAAKLVKLV
jgi:hypothetical protein